MDLGPPLPVAAIVRNLDAYVGENLRRYGDPGGALVVVNGRGIVHCRGFGVEPKGHAVSCTTPFALASLTKSITSVAVMRCVEAGTVRLDATVRSVLPWFRVNDPRGDAVTLRDVLLMRSGIGTATGRAWLASTDGGPRVLERRVRALAGAALASAPGSAYEYSNANYDIAGAVVERCLRKPYTAAVHDEVLQPLGALPATFARHGLRGFTRWFGAPLPAGVPPDVEADAPAAGAVMTPLAYGRYLAAHLDAGRSWSRRILSPAGWATLHHSPPALPYAMGWTEIEGAGVHELRHGGDAPDFHAEAVFFPEWNLGAALFVNANDGVDGGRALNLDANVARIMRGRDPAVPPPIQPDLPPRIALLAACILTLVTTVRAIRARHALSMSATAIAAVVIVAIPVVLLRPSGGSLAVDLLYAPDITLLAMVTWLAAVAGTLASAAFTVRARHRRSRVAK